MYTSLSLSNSSSTRPSSPVSSTSPSVTAIFFTALNFFSPPLFTTALPETSRIFPIFFVSFAIAAPGDSSVTASTRDSTILMNFKVNPPLRKPQFPALYL
ncbi:hypothetical protein D3C81_1906240 [compost metagenome]